MEIRRRAGEHYIQTRLGRGWTLRIRGSKAILSTMEGGFEVVMPVKAILEPDGLRRRGV